MKDGDYVRFDYHKVSVPIMIARIIESHYDDEDDSICYLTDIGLVIDEGNLVKKPSESITDLIEIGDVLSFKDKGICRVLQIPTEKQPYFLLKDYSGEQYYEKSEWVEEFDKILTHEQFETNAYKRVVV